MTDVTYYTQEGLEKLKEELHYLKTEGRSQISKAIAEARDKGDLSENAEYDAAKEAQGHHESKISKLTNVLANARLIDESKLDSSKVLALSIVKIKNINNGAIMTYQLVSETEADLKSGKYRLNRRLHRGCLVNLSEIQPRLLYRPVKLSLRSLRSADNYILWFET